MGASRNRMIAEVAVLAGIVFLAPALVLPFITSARTRSRADSSASNNLKQISLGAPQLRRTFGNPKSQDGWMSRSRPARSRIPTLPPERRLSWMVALSAVHRGGSTRTRQFDLKAGFDAAAESTAAGNADPACSTATRSVAGRSPITSASPASVRTRRGCRPATARAGAFGYDRRTRAAPAGSPTARRTRCCSSKPADKPRHWAAGGPATVRGIDLAATPCTSEPGLPFGGIPPQLDVAVRGRYRHGVMIAMADGSVRIVRQKTDPAVVEALATVAGNESLPADW